MSRCYKDQGACICDECISYFVTTPTRANREGDTQALPTHNDRTPVADLVIADIERRRAVGIERYGTPLQAFNGRNALIDAYEEVLDLACYLRQRIEEERNG